MDTVDRRDFMKSVAGAAALVATGDGAAAGEGPAAEAPRAAGQKEDGATADRPVFLTTWKFGLAANQRAAEVLAASGNLLDAVEKGINVVEDDPAITSVGYGGLPNADGVVELDAGIMDGTRHRAVAICNLHQIQNPISVARMALERTRETTYAGEGAFLMALQFGFHPRQLLTPESLKQWQRWRANPERTTFWVNEANHDTIGMLACDGHGHLVSGCSTSGMAFKIPGRVADSPLVGCGIYADDNAGAATATGDGDLMTNYCTSIVIVQLMARGASPQEACEELLRWMVRTDAKNRASASAVIAMDPQGRIGAACMNTSFHLQYAVWRNGRGEVRDGKTLFA
ncbi:MAG: N(4)-(beta-N-acetylglucosaminyl)-L-asparaginase [Terriglobales bacterium]